MQKGASFGFCPVSLLWQNVSDISTDHPGQYALQARVQAHICHTYM